MSLKTEILTEIYDNMAKSYFEILKDSRFIELQKQDNTAITELQTQTRNLCRLYKIILDHDFTKPLFLGVDYNCDFVEVKNPLNCLGVIPEYPPFEVVNKIFKSAYENRLSYIEVLNDSV